MINYIFSGIGQAVGRYKITNDDINNAVEKGLLRGFDKSKILASKNYHLFLEKYPNVSPFDYFVKYKMGFEERRFVVPFPPRKKHFLRTENASELAVDAIKEALNDANISANEIGAWFLSTVSAQEKAPGIAATVKTYFVDKNNLSPTFTLASGCAGFNLNLERAKEYLQMHKGIQHVVVAHTETMSSFLTEKSKFVSFATFGDGAGAVILSKVESDKKEGLLFIENYQDLKMIDFVGVDKYKNLYMGESVIKNRAIVDMQKSALSVMEKTNLKIEDIDCWLPHQTGNAILEEVRLFLNIPKEKMNIKAQQKYANVSGATVPLGLSIMNKDKELKENQYILSTTAGVGGKYGAFVYRVPRKKTKKKFKKTSFLKDKKVLIVGGTSGLGKAVVEQLQDEGAICVLTYRDKEKLKQFSKNIKAYKLDLQNKESIQQAIATIKKEHLFFDYIILAAGTSGSLQQAGSVSDKEVKKIYQTNFLSLVQIYQSFIDSVKETVLWIGSAAEDAQFSGSSAYVSSKKSLHGFVAAASWEAFSKGIRMVYYMPGVVNTGMTEQLSEKQQFAAMQMINQEQILEKQELADRIVKSLCLIKVKMVDDTFENILTVRRDGYLVADSRW